MLWFAPAGDASASTEVRAETERVGGAATLLRAPPSVRAAEGVFPRQSDGIERIAAAIRSGFDPAGVLNPGRMGA
jgi:glycolate oxidase FAD binding subunit